jgi:P4 family phage/plasmid primase-like protien
MQGDLDKIETLEKMAAYCFYRKYPIQKAFMLLGAGSNGKSTLLNLITQMLGKENVSNVELQSFETNRFATADLYNKNANIFADISSNALKNNSTFKSMCGDVDTLRSERKFQNSFGFNNHAKLIFSANQLPETHEESDAFFRRWVIIEFNRQFTGTEVNPNLTKEITDPEEMDKFFSHLMPKLRDILSGYFITEETIEEAREKYMRNANSTTFFATDFLEMDFEASSGKNEIWASYLTFCKERRLQVRTEKSFWSTIYRHFGDKIYERQVTNPLTRERQRTIYGIKLISQEEKESKDIHQNMRMRDLGKKILEYLLAYNGPEAPRFPITYFHDGVWEDQIQIRKLFWELKKAGVINEPVHGLYEVDKARAGI